MLLMIRGARRLWGDTLAVLQKNRTLSPNWKQNLLASFPFRRGAGYGEHYRVNKTDLREESNSNSSTTSNPASSHYEPVIEQQASKKAFPLRMRGYIFHNGVSPSLLYLKEWLKNPQAAAALAGFGSCLSCVTELHDGGENTEDLLRLGSSEMKTANLRKILGQWL